jgi:hypothetical protein
MLRLSEVLPLSSEIMAKYYKEFYARNGKRGISKLTVCQERINPVSFLRQHKE